jgi:hypothetical protein
VGQSHRAAKSGKNIRGEGEVKAPRGIWGIRGALQAAPAQGGTEERPGNFLMNWPFQTLECPSRRIITELMEKSRSLSFTGINFTRIPKNAEIM